MTRRADRKRSIVAGAIVVAWGVVCLTAFNRTLQATLPSPVDDSSAKAALVVDAGKKTGRFRGLHRGFSGGFEALASTEGLKPYLGPIGATSLRAPVVREPGKGQPFFKGTTLADTQDAAMYDFRMIDQFVARIDALGLDILATLAEMPSSLSADGTGKGPPKDPKVFAEMVKHVVLHLTQGWADGHHYPILYWEIWNEPNLSKNPRVRQAYWTGTREQYLEMYAETAQAIASLPPLPNGRRYRVGGPALAGLDEWAEPFVRFCAERQVPLDFFSFHHYDDDPQAYEPLIRRAKALLGPYPRFRDTELILDEWNMAIGPWGSGPGQRQGLELVFWVICSPKFAVPPAAVHLARTLMIMERSALTRANHFLLADNGVTTMGVITCPEIPVPPRAPSVAPPQAGPRLHYHVLRAFEMLGRTPELVEVALTGDRLDALAGISAGEDRLTLVMVNWGDPRTIRVEVQNLPWAVGHDTPPACTWEARAVDPKLFEEGKALETVASGTGYDWGLDVPLELPSQSIVVLSVRGSGED